jgi:myo-inositol-1(or 4)-monophosphatase
MSPSADQLAEYTTFAEQLADAAASVITSYFRTDLVAENKGGILFDPVTVADKAAERVMRQMIRAHYPSHGILGEELGMEAGQSEWTWVLDPIDGTVAFISGLPVWGTLVALNNGHRPVLGVMNQPFTRERYLGTASGAWRNGMPLKTRNCCSMATATLMCTTPAMFHTPAHRTAFETLAAQAKLLQFGGDCYAYCMVASGFADVIVEAGLEPYDIQALIPIVEGAGGVVSTWQGTSAQNGGAIVACGDRRLHAQLLEMLRQTA